MDNLFNGALYLVRLEYIIKNQGNRVVTISNRDMDSIMNYVSLAIRPISLYAEQYGQNSLQMHKNMITITVTISDTSFDDNQLKNWVNDILDLNNLPDNSCIIIPFPSGISNTSWDKGTKGYHYHDKIPYILSRVSGNFDVNGDLTLPDLNGIQRNLFVEDTFFSYAGSLSHEIAEMTVNPSGGNPEVCDPCGPNSVSTYLNYFDNAGNYLQTTQTPPYLVNFQFGFYINGIVQSGVNDIGYANDKIIPENACIYAPPLPAIPLEVAFQANTSNLWSVGWDNHGDWKLGMMPGTNPSITVLSNGDYVIAFQANTGNLWTIGGDNHGDWQLGMMAGTSPSIAALPDGGYVVAFQANTGNLWTIGGDNHGDWQLGMMAGTSPSIAALPDGGYVVAFQANTSNLWTIGADNRGDWQLGMMPGTSPSITVLSDGSYEVAFQANTTNLWLVGADYQGDTQYGMMQGTNPSITGLSEGGFVVAFQANTGNLWTVGADNLGDWQLGMMPGTSPSIAELPDGGYEIAFQANTGNLWTVSDKNLDDWKLGMMARTSPSITRKFLL